MAGWRDCNHNEGSTMDAWFVWINWIVEAFRSGRIDRTSFDSYILRIIHTK